MLHARFLGFWAEFLPNSSVHIFILMIVDKNWFYRNSGVWDCVWEPTGPGKRDMGFGPSYWGALGGGGVTRATGARSPPKAPQFLSLGPFSVWSQTSRFAWLNSVLFVESPWAELSIEVCNRFPSLYLSEFCSQFITLVQSGAKVLGLSVHCHRKTVGRQGVQYNESRTPPTAPWTHVRPVCLNVWEFQLKKNNGNRHRFHTETFD